MVHIHVDIYGLTGINSNVQKGHKKDQNSPMETSELVSDVVALSIIIHELSFFE